MSIDFAASVTLWSADEIKSQDVYFQPGLTWTPQGKTQGIALLFLENYDDSGDINKQDFRELVKGLVRWVCAAAGTQDDVLALDDVQNLYDEFTTSSLSYKNLATFLSRHYRFEVQVCSGDMEGTVFPMFPRLQLKVGNTDSVSFSPADRQLDAGDVARLRAYYGQLQVQFEAGSKTSTIEASAITEFLFVGYVRLLIRSGLQALIDELKNGGSADSISNLLERLANTAYRNIARMASRFLLNGFNLPEDFFGTDDPAADEGLYVSSGQQYAFSASAMTTDSSSNYQVSLQIGDSAETFIAFPEDAQELIYSIEADASDHPFWDLASALNTLTETDAARLHPAQAKLISPYRSENLHFALRHRVDWSQDSKYLLPLSSALLDHLEQFEPNPLVNLIIWPNGNPAQARDIPNADFSWATRIDLSIRRIANPDSDGFLKETYEIGSSSEKDKDLLEAVLNFLNDTTESDPLALDLLYVSDAGGTTNPAVTRMPGQQDNILLLKANLSTETTDAASTEFSATLARKKDFLTLLWKALDVDSGGFYLHIPHGDDSLDTTLFDSDINAVLPFLIQFTNTSDPIHDFNNYAVFSATIDVDKDLLLARSDKTIPVLTIPPGFLGFQINDRPQAEPPADNDAVEELKVLYQLLGWQVADSTQFNSSNPGLPVGPTELPPDQWLYEKLVPVFSRAKTVSTGAADLPSHGKDPYLGVGASSALKIETWWQDIYGNQLSPSQQEQTFPVRYTDALIGINQWPSVSENYAFFREETDKITLQLSLSFDSTPYELASHEAAQDPETSRRNRIEGDKTTIEKVYYQLIQTDVEFSVSTSVDSVKRANTLDKTPILNFVEAIYRYLDASLNNTAPAKPSAYSQNIDVSTITINPSFIFPVTVEMLMSRNLDKIADELKDSGKIKSEYENVLHAPAILSPKPEAVSNTDETLMLRTFADNFQKAFPGLYLAVSEERQNRTRSGISRQPPFAVRLGTKGINYDIKEGQPVYYAIPPLSNVLLSDEVAVENYADWKNTIPDNADLNTLSYSPASENSQFDAIDLNILARSFLVVLENFLDPATLIPAYRLFPAKVDGILQQKAVLAKALSDDIQAVLKKDRGAEKITAQFAEAKEAIRQELLVDLVNGYDIETIVQFDVTASAATSIESNSNQSSDFAPRVRGKARITGAKVGEDPDSRVAVSPDSLDFKLSTGQIRLLTDSELQNGSKTSYFTYLFDTKTPELFANIELDLEFMPVEIEYDIRKIEGITERLASNFLNFILPEGLEQSMGSSSIPIPLREYPAPPSLIFQQAEADPSSRTDLADVRQWQYTIVYEHLDISQDSIDCILQLNVPPIDNLPTESGTVSSPAALFHSLINFAEVYPQIATDLNSLRDERLLTDAALEKQAKIAIIAFQTLVSRIASDWKNWLTDVKIYQPKEGDLHFVISEETLSDEERQGLVTIEQTVSSKIGGSAIAPALALPGYKQKEQPDIGEKTVRFTFTKDPEDLTFFGDSSIPDRKFTVENLDVIEHHNAWASVWLSRNKDLIRTSEAGVLATNPAFIFQTPAVRFNTMVTPFITNDEPWDIATLGSDDDPSVPQRRSLLQHLRIMLQTLFPDFDGSQYEVRLSCRYAFALATGKGLNEDLITTLPILLGLQITPKELAESYASDLRNEISLWLSANQPSTEEAALMFTVDLFSKLDEESTSSLPTLRITQLSLGLEQIEDLNELMA